MRDHETRVAILRRHGEGHGQRVIAKALGLSRGAVWRVLERGRAARAAMTEPCADLEDNDDEQERMHDA
jgi:DNA-directed RNA polymerase specialized sigma24 family protein